MIHKLRASLFWLTLAPAVLLGCGGKIEQGPEICDNGVDDNGNGQVDCEETACVQADNCIIPPTCGNGALDAGEECDGALLGGKDCNDFPPNNTGTISCKANCTIDSSGCSQAALTENDEVKCANGLDDDQDGFSDCADTDCVGALPPNGVNICAGIENCGDGIDNDFDSAIDCADNDCRAGANPDVRCQEGFVNGATNNCADTKDNDLDGLVDCLDIADCSNNTACNGTPEDCTAPADEDNDGFINCQDSDCVADPACAASPDIDCDGIANADEANFGTSATDADSDNDGILDGVEVGVTTPVAGATCPGFAGDADPATTTSPTDPDTDNDGLCDDGIAVAGVCVAGEDTNHNGAVDNLESNPSDNDSDNDGLLDGVEATLGTNPNDNDTDNDGLLDGVEDADHDGIKDTNETNALSADTDCDGLSDSAEVNGNTDATRADTDGDGLSDGVESGITAAVNGTNCVNVKLDGDPTSTTNPNNIDSDNDGIIDGAEDRDQDGVKDANELNPNSTDTDGDQLPDGIEDGNKNGVKDAAETDGTKADTDGDTIPDGVEDANHNGAVNAGELNPRVTDTDFDGLPDNIEDANGNGVFNTGETNGTVKDTDNDGIDDGIEDFDRDGVRDATESSPLLTDSDFDGLTDNFEDANKNGQLDAGETKTFSSDSDCDGLGDLNERSISFAGGLKTNPALADTDGDGLTDGQELGATQVLANSGCASIIVDADTATKTNPTAADTDGDQRSDGCEDANKNGRVDVPEMNPNLFDSDGDGLSDTVEDTSGTCTSPGAVDSDSDNDGIGDAIEVNITGTNPNNPDTDGDGINDGIEDANQDGVVNLGETDPTDADTDNDLINDGIEDANHNGNFDSGETDPADTDTDNDGILDGTEDANHNGIFEPNIALGSETDPRDPDTDSDGLLDGFEDIDHDGIFEPNAATGSETNPLDSDSDNDGLLDSDEVLAGTNPLNPNDPAGDTGTGIQAVCTAATLKPVNFFEDVGGLSQGGDWTVALETTYNYSAATAAGGDHVAVLRDNAALASTQLAGFVLDVAPPAAGTNASTQAAQFVARLTAAAGVTALGASSVTIISNGRASTSSDNFNNVVDIQATITLSAATDPSTMNNRIIGVLTNRALNTFTGLPGAGGATATQYTLRFSSLVRTNINGTTNIPGTRVVLLGGVEATATFNNAALVKGIELKDLSNGTALARAFVGDTFECNSFTVTASPKADFIWMSDISGSTNNDRGVIRAASSAVFTGLQNNGVDFRMGIVLHNFSTNSATTTFSGINNVNVAPPTGNAGLLVQDADGNATLDTPAAGIGFTTNLTTFDRTLAIQGGNGQEHGLTAIRNSLQRALPRTNAGATVDAQKLRKDAVPVIFYLSDEHEELMEVNSGTTGTFNAARSTPNATQQTAINNIVAPFINQISGASSTSGFCSNNPGLACTTANQTAVCGAGNTCTLPLASDGGLPGIAFGQIAPFNPATDCSGVAAYDNTNGFCSNNSATACTTANQATNCGAANFCIVDDSLESGRGYSEVTTATGGNFYFVCNNNPGAVLQQIVDAVTGAASEFTLSSVPISSTLKVARVPVGCTTQACVDIVPRSASDGFDYDAVANTIFFRGATHRPAVGQKVVVSFRLYTPPVPPLVCTPPLTPNASQTACECASNAATGQCGTGTGSDTCDVATETCNADPAVCGCECKPDCGGGISGNFECGFPTVCGPVCGDANNDGTIDCNNACTGNFRCNAGTCGCECPDLNPGDENPDCNGTVVGNQICDLLTCTAFCPVDCGGCLSNETCDVNACACVPNNNN